MRPEFQSPTSWLQVQKPTFEKSPFVKFIKPLHSLHHFVYLIKRDLQVLKPESQDANATKIAQCEQHTIEYVHPEETGKQEETSSEQEQDDEVAIQSQQFIQPSTGQMQAMQQMYMPYIDGPKIVGTVNESLYHRFLKWKIKCKNILDCELAMLSEAKKM